MGRKMTRGGRMAAAAALALGALGVGATQVPARASDPVCGWVRYSSNDGSTTSTVPGLPYCDLPCGSAVNAGTGDHHVWHVYAEGFVCVHIPV